MTVDLTEQQEAILNDHATRFGMLPAEAVRMLILGWISGVPAPKKAKKAVAPKVISPPESTTPELFDIVQSWLDYKKERGQGYTAKGADQLVRRLAGMGPERALAAVHYSMAMNYSGIFEPSGVARGRERAGGSAGHRTEVRRASDAVPEWKAPR